ncbi:YbaN family protein [Peptococcus simiae]|uniref:YbaN family protein n=1 Tax=Peptococcus simiae TaxID=1643805 RepID=A0ABW9GXZ3_9FIRM
MRYLFFLLGSLALACGTLGIILPVLPTVPFYLLAAACFGKSSDRFHRYFTQTAFYRNYCAAYLEKGGMTRRQKIKILLLSTVLLTAAIIFAPYVQVRVGLIILMAVKYYIFACRIPTLKEENA